MKITLDNLPENSFTLLFDDTYMFIDNKTLETLEEFSFKIFLQLNLKAIFSRILLWLYSVSSCPNLKNCN